MDLSKEIEKAQYYIKGQRESVVSEIEYMIEKLSDLKRGFERGDDFLSLPSQDRLANEFARLQGFKARLETLEDLSN